MFITFEGTEGAGKTTILYKLKHYFESLGRTVLCTREPGGSKFGLHLRSTLLNEHANIHPRAELFLFLADRAQHVEEVLRPALARGDVILCDRYIHSTLAYQGAGRGLSAQLIEKFNDFAIDGLMPHKVLLLNLDVELGLARAFARNTNNKKNEGRFDTECITFHRAVQASFLEQAQKDAQRFHIIDASQNVEGVLKDCIKAININPIN